MMVLWREGYRRGLGDDSAVTHIPASSFPAYAPPLPCAVKGQGNTREVVIGSSWRRAAVDLWFDDFLPPDMADALDRRAARDAGDVMDDRATSLRLVG